MEKSLERKLRKRFYHIKERCNNVNCKCYGRYGGRGIRCERESIEDFIKDMGPSFEEHVNKYGIDETTIDRIDVNGNYCKENCRRATWKEQGKNRRECRQFDYDGKHFETLRDLANYVGLPEDSIRYRLNAGWNLKDAVETEIINNKIGINYNGVCYESIGSLCSQLGLSWKIVYNRLRKGWSIEEAVGKAKKESKHAIEYRGQKFNSLKELAKYYNIPYGTIKRRVQAGYTGDELIEGKMIEYRGKKYKTAMDIAKEYGISIQAIYCRVFKGKELIEAIDDALNYKQSKCTHSQIMPPQKSIQQARILPNI